VSATKGGEPERERSIVLKAGKSGGQITAGSRDRAPPRSVDYEQAVNGALPRLLVAYGEPIFADKKSSTDVLTNDKKRGN